ncbi:MAG: methyltransferase domain-containing protein [Pseudomonadota bacterium]
MTARPEDILPTYDRVGRAFAEERVKDLFEKPALDRFRAALPGPRVLDVGCGSGDPIALYLARNGCAVTGLDGARTMVELFRETLPAAQCYHADMRTFDLGEKFDGVLAFNSLFHLTVEDQRAALARMAAHAGPDAALMFTSGPDAGEAFGHVDGVAVYHASLAPADYCALLLEHGFQTLSFRPNDPECREHTLWLAKRIGDGAAGAPG